jgi:hypothetical protein
MPMLRNITFAALMMTVTASTVMACLCADRPRTESSAEADDVFIGKVLRSDGSENGYTTFEVLHWLKGNRRQSVLVSGVPCDIWFIKGSTYIVYARETQSRLTIDSCAGTSVIDEPYKFTATAVSACDNYEIHRSYREIAVITASSVALSLTLGVLVGAAKRRFKQ